MPFYDGAFLVVHPVCHEPVSYTTEELFVSLDDVIVGLGDWM
jgi:hypothetical protein